MVTSESMGEFMFDAGFAPQSERRALPVAIGEAIQNMLLTGQLKPGDKLPTEAAFTQQYNVGRNSYREAIKMLSSIGVVEIVRGEGTFIKKELDPAAIISPLVLQLAFMQAPSRQIVELRLLLEVGTTELVLDRLEDGDLERLEEANARLLAASEGDDPDPDRLLELDMNFHAVLLELTRNEVIRHLYEAVSKLFAASVRQSVNQSPRTAFENHASIIAALRSGDREEVRRTTRPSFAFWSDILDGREVEGAEVEE